VRGQKYPSLGMSSVFIVFAAIQRERGRGKTQKTYFLKNITIFFVLLEFFCNFAD
jgi:hypothetical protein